jgi:hypothetical protein
MDTMQGLEKGSFIGAREGLIGNSAPSLKFKMMVGAVPS